MFRVSADVVLAHFIGTESGKYTNQYLFVLVRVLLGNAVYVYVEYKVFVDLLICDFFHKT